MIAILLTLGCGARAEPPARHLTVPPSHPLHDRLEGAGLPNGCAADSDCHVSGCSAELCSAARDLTTTCEALELRWPPGNACGCVDGTCAWWNPSGATLP